MEIPVRGAKAKVLVAGEGKPVVFLHGAGGLKWDPYLEELAKEYKVYAPYFPGSEGTKRSIELDLRNLWDLVLYYCDLLDALGLESVDIIGHSFGGMLAAEIASTDPKRVKKLILISAAGLWNEEYPIQLSTLTSPPQEMLPKLFYDVNSSLAQAAVTMPEDPEERMKAVLEQQIVLAEMLGYLWPIPDKGLNRRLHRIRANTCIVWGEKDGLIPVRYAYDFQKKIPGSKVEIIANASHLPQLEQLSSVLNITSSFLKTS
jgi:pimeloyl-ACP methyl ester carboxylesterase